MVSTASITIMFLNIILAIAIPVTILIVFKKKYVASVVSFIVGCATFLVFALILEQILHAIVLMVLPIGQTIQNNIWLYAIYGALAAGVFEESGRYIAFKYVLKDKYSDASNALMYGAGHGGFEMFYILGMGMVNNWLYSVMINSGQTELILGQLEGVSKVQVEAIIDELINTSPYIFLLSPIERISAFVIQISLSVLVWTGVTKGKKWMYPLAIALHYMVDFVAVVLSAQGVNTILIEVALVLIALVMATSIKKYIWDVYLKALNFQG